MNCVWPIHVKMNRRKVNRDFRFRLEGRAKDVGLASLGYYEVRGMAEIGKAHQRSLRS